MQTSNYPKPFVEKLPPLKRLELLLGLVVLSWGAILLTLA